MLFFNYLIDKVFQPKTLASATRRAGYAKDQMGIRNRYLREKGNWQSHIDNTRKFILKSAETIQRHGSVAVLGSGWLYDVPVDELSQMFGNVYLFDIVHPEPVKIKVGRLPNVHLVTADLTCGAVLKATQSGSYPDFMSYLENSRPDIDLNGYDMVVSVNLLNQLDIILCDYLKGRFAVGSEQLRKVRSIVQQRHVDNLPKGKSCLITDYLQIDKPIDGSPETQTELLYCDLPQNVPFEEWFWFFDTEQRYSVKNNTTFKVRGVRF